MLFPFIHISTSSILRSNKNEILKLLLTKKWPLHRVIQNLVDCDLTGDENIRLRIKY